MVLNVVGMIVLRQIYLAVTLLHAATPNIYHIYYAYPLTWAATLVMLIVYYLLVKNQLREPEQ